MINENLTYEILAVVEKISVGKVATYGQIARLIGGDKNSRLVGKVLSMSEYYGNYSCHRVVNQVGRNVPNWTEQAELLKDEGVIFRSNGNVNLKLCQWNR